MKFLRSFFYRQGNGLAVFDGKARQYYSAFTLVNKRLVSFQLSATSASAKKGFDVHLCIEDYDRGLANRLKHRTELNKHYLVY